VAGRRVLAATSVGSGVAFLDGTIVNTALPAIGRSFDGVGAAQLAGLQWVLTAYLLSLGALLVLGGSLGDMFGRRRLFLIGVWAFGASSLACGAAPTLGTLVVGRVLQGVGAAALVPCSLAIISAVFAPEDRARAIGAWTGLTGVATAIGPFVGGSLIDQLSWRWVFAVNAPLCIAAAALATRHVPESSDLSAGRRIDVIGAVLLSAGLGAVVYALIEGPASGWSDLVLVACSGGVLALGAFCVVETRSRQPMVPFDMFRSRVFVGANIVTFVVWGAMGAVFFLVAVHLQQNLGYSALEAGAALIPITILMLAFSVRSGEWSRTHGARAPMTLGTLAVAAGFTLFTRVAPGVSYPLGVLPAVVVLGIGLVASVSPLTVVVLAAVDDDRIGLGSAVNYAVARIAALLAVAVLPALAGIHDIGTSLDAGFSRAMVICAALAVVGAVVAATTIAAARDGPSPSVGT
jgi:EmrB/QacA subfamily drug resistance transporter